ncbi:hypothetical protein [Streptomyces sp. YS-3]|uniref:hypothetical protein n=1 Tax=Streptomyces sp. YS-3 TaxID=3381352 RepID=UPI003862A0A2
MRLTGRTAPASAAAYAAQRKTVTGLASALIALAGMTLAAPATAAEHRAAVPSGDYCNANQGFYGGGQYTYAEVQVCLRFASSGNQVIVNARNNQYYYGGAWYNASSSYPARWSATGSVGIGGQSGNYNTGTVTQGSPTGSASGGSPSSIGACGTYSVTLNFHQNGPYWTDGSNDINSGQKSYSISVAC